VRSLFSYQAFSSITSPFLLLDHAGPIDFPPSAEPRGVDEHPHRGFETVTVVYQGEVEHRDSAGNSGTIGPGDVQWMTAGSGIVHEEKHSAEFTLRGGTMEMAQLWINLPKKFKGAPPRYQTLLAPSIPSVELEGGRLRVISGSFRGSAGPAQTFTTLDVWDLRLHAGGRAELEIPGERTTVLALLRGSLGVNRSHALEASCAALFDRQPGRITLEASDEATFLVLSGEPIDEPLVGYGPFVMNTREEIRESIEEYQTGRMGRIAR
jgi:redox-sensitive bicupin YhaK (pirin superfamily)